MSHSISRANLGGFFLSHKLAVVNLFQLAAPLIYQKFNYLRRKHKTLDLCPLSDQARLAERLGA